MKKYLLLMIVCVTICCLIFTIKEKVPNDNSSYLPDDGSNLILEQTTQTGPPVGDEVQESIPKYENSYTALNFENPNAIWVSYLLYSEILLNKSEEEFTQNVEECFNNVKDLGINTVYVQVRSHANSYYTSELFPNGEYYNSDFDPLEIMVSMAHQKGLSIHAWINPMRCMTTESMDDLSDVYTVKQWYDTKKGSYVCECDDYWYLNPYYEEVRTFICEGVKEVMDNYQVDGIHIDDYFYPTTEESFDSESFLESGLSDLLQFRRDNVNSLVKEMYSTVKSINPSVEFGISPQGNVDKDLNEQCADVELWTSTEGYCDYIVPQIYYGFDNSTCPYVDTLNRWSALNQNSSVKLIIGLGAYKVGKEDTWAGNGIDEWVNGKNIIASQIDYAFNTSTVKGIALFDYGSIFMPDSDIVSRMDEEVLSVKESLVTTT